MMLQERRHMIAGHHRVLADAFLIEIEVAEGVHDGVALQKLRHLRLAGVVLSQMSTARLVGNVEEDVLFINTQRLHPCSQSRQEGIQEPTILLADGVAFPAEELLIFPIHGRHDLGAVLGAPLGVKMGDLKIFNPAAAA